eukprot:3912869-Prymnesium_polylepis.1
MAPPTRSCAHGTQGTGKLAVQRGVWPGRTCELVFDDLDFGFQRTMLDGSRDGEIESHAIVRWTMLPRETWVAKAQVAPRTG